MNKIVAIKYEHFYFLKNALVCFLCWKWMRYNHCLRFNLPNPSCYENYENSNISRNGWFFGCSFRSIGALTCSLHPSSPFSTPQWTILERRPLMLLHRSSCSFVCLSFRACCLCGCKTAAEERAAQLRFHSELLNVRRRGAPTLPIKLCLSPTSPESTHAVHSLSCQGNQLLKWTEVLLCAI